MSGVDYETRYDDIVEVMETPISRVNQYLEHGYRLLRIHGITQAIPRQDNNQIWIRHRLIYVVGRTAEIEHYEPPRRNENAEGQKS